ncbi:MAG: hypothetical protein Q9M36_06120 [Sulfurovum sp.]|nr:hypothetical protein [Sulfurovum sp.]
MKTKLLHTKTPKPHHSDDPYMLEALVVIKKKAPILLNLKQEILQKKRKAFLFKKINLKEVAFLPSSDFGLFLTFTFVPYLFGFIFIFFYIFSARMEYFTHVLSHYPFLWIWMIGYEMIAVTIVVWVIKIVLFSFKVTDQEVRKEKLKRGKRLDRASIRR